MLSTTPFRLFQEKLEAKIGEIKELEILSEIAKDNPAFGEITSDLEQARNQLNVFLHECRFLLH